MGRAGFVAFFVAVFGDFWLNPPRQLFRDFSMGRAGFVAFFVAVFGDFWLNPPRQLMTYLNYY